MIEIIIQELINVLFTLFSVLIISYVYWRWFNIRLFENFKITDEEDNKNN